MQQLIYDNRIAGCVANALIKTGAYKIVKTNDRSKWFTWKSGVNAPVYCNTRHLFGSPTERLLVATNLARAVKEHFPSCEGVVGLATGGVGWTMAVAESLNLPMGYVRSEPKAHGLGGAVEYAQSHHSVVLIDDLVASGCSLEKAIDNLAETGLTVAGVLSVVNWNFPSMKSRLQSRLPVKTLVSYPHIVQALIEQGCVGAAEHADLLAFYKSPKDHLWSNSIFAIGGGVLCRARAS